MTKTIAKPYNVRKLNALDLFKMTKILSVVSGEIRETMKESKMEEMDSQILGIMIVEAAMKHAEGQMKELLADLVGLSVEEFEKESFDAPLEILGTLAEQEDLKGFLQKAQGLMKKFTGK
jgi:hypothetical protein